MDYFCCDEPRRNLVKGHPTLNGIDFLEVLDQRSDTFEQRQTTLYVHFVNDLIPGILNGRNVIIEGGERVTNIRVIWAGTMLTSPLSPAGTKILAVKVSEAGDFSTYTLRLVRSEKDKNPPDDFDQVLSAVDFSFKVLCSSDFDCNHIL